MEDAGRREGVSRDGTEGESTGEALDAGLTAGRVVGEIFDRWRGGWTVVNDGDDVRG